MFGTNKRVSLIEITRVNDDAGAIGDEVETVVASNISATYQPHVLNNLPPPSDRPTPAGQYYLREQRCWIAMRDLPSITPKTMWLVEDDVTGERFRIRAVIDDAGRGHHWLLRMENYDG